MRRFLYKNNKSVPASFEYTGIRSDSEDGRSIFFAAESNDYYFIGGRATRLVEGDDWDGIEIGVYSKSNCEQIKRFRFISGNQLYACRQKDCAWFPRDQKYQVNPPIMKSTQTVLFFTSWTIRLPEHIFTTLTALMKNWKLNYNISFAEIFSITS